MPDPKEHIHIDAAGNVNPNATTVTNNYYLDEKRSERIARGYSNIREEIGKGLDEHTKNAVKHYETKLPGTKDMEEKLTDGGFKPADIREARRLKEFWSMEAYSTADYMGIQEDNLDLYSRIVHEFKIYITPMVEDEKPLREIMTVLHEQIVKPILEIYQRNGYSEENLRYTCDHIYGMIYYLTGNCHLNWKDYDNV